MVTMVSQPARSFSLKSASHFSALTSPWMDRAREEITDDKTHKNKEFKSREIKKHVKIAIPEGLIEL